MKNLSSKWTALALIVPLLAVLGLVLADGCGGGGSSSGTAAAARVPVSNGYVAVGFNTSNLSASGYKNVFLNVVEIRMNPSTSPDVSEFSPHWVTITAPQATGIRAPTGFISTGSGFGGLFYGATSNALIGQGRPEMQIDMNALQNTSELFNVAQAPPRSYYQFEVFLDPLQAGNVIPTCSGALGEGCVNYPAVMNSSLQTRYLKFSLPASGSGFQVAKQQLSPLIFALNVAVGPPPLGSTGPVTITPAIDNLIQTGSNGVFPAGALAGTITGTVEYPKGKTTFDASHRPVTITAELSGTNQVIESVPLPASCNKKSTCGFSLFLPATSVGTAYDIYASGKSNSFAVAGNLVLVASQSVVAPTLQIEQRTSSSFSGRIVDQCGAGVGIAAATLQLLVPDPAVSGADCGTSPTGCVSVATGSSDEAGYFPMPGNGFNRSPFAHLPVEPNESNYGLSVNAAGFDSFLAEIVPAQTNYKCPSPATRVSNVCTISLSHGTLTGHVAVAIPANASPTLPQVNVLVVAEDHGSNNIENVQMVTIPPGSTASTQIPFSINVPLSSSVGSFDVFATAQDVFNGMPQITTGHTYGVAANIQNVTDSCTSSPTAISPPQDPLTIECAGHGSLFGPQSVANVGTDTSLVLSKQDPTNGEYVDVQTIGVAPPPSSTSATYAICAPPDAYELTAFDSGVAGSPVAAVVSTPVPAPSPTPSPCPQVCDSGQGSQCLICNQTIGPVVVAPTP